MSPAKRLIHLLLLATACAPAKQTSLNGTWFDEVHNVTMTISLPMARESGTCDGVITIKGETWDNTNHQYDPHCLRSGKSTCQVAMVFESLLLQCDDGVQRTYGRVR